MLKPLTIRGLCLGEGQPKICIPIVGQTETEIIKEAGALLKLPVDLVEWRADWFDGLKSEERLLKVLAVLRAELGENIPLIFTIRTKQEGGEAAVTEEEYIALNRKAAQSGLADFIDVETNRGADTARTLIAGVHEAGGKVILSNHSFHETPSTEDMVRRMRKMQLLGGDVSKLAVMPECASDVIRLLDASCQMLEIYADRPFITMSMSGLGAVSRLAGETFGSCLTFGCAKKASAPGQLEAGELSEILKILHQSR